MSELIKREIQILRLVENTHIVKLFDVARTDNNLYLFFELCMDGDLHEYQQKKENKRLSEAEAVIFLKHIVEAFKELYRKKVIHRDIKPANILLHEGCAKITDFGLSRIVDNIDMNSPALFSRVGSPLYMSP